MKKNGISVVVSQIIVAFSFVIISTDDQLEAQDKYCGIYSLYAAAASHDVEVDFDDLATTTYVSSLSGSTANDLVRAANSISLNAYPLEGLTISDLEQLGQPVLLNTYSSGQLEYPNHWVVFLGMDGDQITIGDGADGIANWTKAELLITWRGAGIVITRKNQEAVFSVIFSRYCFTALKILLLVLAVHLVTLLKVVRSSVFCGIVGVGSGTLLGTFVTCYSSGDGIANRDNRDSLVFVEHLLGNRAVPKISLDQLREYHTGEYLLVDSRFSKDFMHGTIEGAINLPVDYSRTEFHETLSDVERSRTIAVFCQNRRCSFSRSVANRLIQLGFKNVYILDSGFDEMGSNR